MAASKAVLKELQTIPSIGPSMARDLAAMGYSSVESLRGEDPFKMYRRLEEISGGRQDSCVLDTFMCAVHYAETGERRDWWSFTPERKAKYGQGRGA